jgi:hypothetical protein
MHVGRKAPRVVKAFGTKVAPGFGLQDLGVHLAFPQDLEMLALGVVIDTGQTYKGERLLRGDA